MIISSNLSTRLHVGRQVPKKRSQQIKASIPPLSENFLAETRQFAWTVNFLSHHVAPCRTMSHHVAPCHIMSHHVASCRTMSHHVAPCRVTPLDKIRTNPICVCAASHSTEQKIFVVDVNQGCQIFLGTWYQNPKKVPNGHKISKMSVKYSKWP
jgi:hypothetical protein